MKKILYYIPYWLQGGVVAVLYVLTIYGLKISCAQNGGLCFADPFLDPMLFPLFSLDGLLSPTQTAYIGTHFLRSLLIAWFCVGAFVGLLYSLVLALFVATKRDKETIIEEKQG